MKWMIFTLLITFCVTRVHAQISTKDETISGSDRIRFDGFYSSDEKDSRLTSSNMFIFTKNGKVEAHQGGTVGNEPFSCEYFSKMNHDYQGTYQIIGDSIYVNLPFLFKKDAFIHARFAIYPARLSGYIKDRNTITDWKVVPPYPKQIRNVSKEFSFNKFWMSSQTMIFIQSDAVKCMVLK